MADADSSNTMADADLHITIFMALGTHGKTFNRPILRVVMADTRDKVTSCEVPTQAFFTSWEAVLFHFKEAVKIDPEYKHAQGMEVILLHSFEKANGYVSIDLVQQTVSALNWMYPRNLTNLFVEFDCGGEGSYRVTDLLLRQARVPPNVEWYGRVFPIQKSTSELCEVPLVAVNFPSEVERGVLSHVRVQANEFKAWLDYSRVSDLSSVVVDSVVFVLPHVEGDIGTDDPTRRMRHVYHPIDDVEKGAVEATITKVENQDVNKVSVLVTQREPHVQKAYQHAPDFRRTPRKPSGWKIRKARFAFGTK